MSRVLRPIYLDHAATTPVLPEVFHAMKPYLTTNYGNPSAAYRKGEDSLEAVEAARKIIADYLNCNPSEIYFTSGGSESDNWAIKGVADYQKMVKKAPRCHIITSAIEHPAVLNSAGYLERKGVAVDYLDVDRTGLISPIKMERKLRPETALVSIMFANNEIGTIEPIEQLGDICQSYKIPFHTDAVQAYGQVPIDVNKMNIDLLSASAHKLGGPKGVGILYIRKGCSLEPFLHGGGQEKGKRSGTENVAGIVGMGKATEIALRNQKQKIKYLCGLRDELANRLLNSISGITINGAWEKASNNTDSLARLPGNLNITITGINARELVAKLDERGVLISTASACASHKSHSSHVLKSIGLSEEAARSTIRITLGADNTHSQISYVVQQIKSLVGDNLPV